MDKKEECFDIVKEVIKEHPDLKDKVSSYGDYTPEQWVEINYKKGQKPECRSITCSRCSKTVHGVEWRDTDGKLADTWGYLDYETLVCDHCAGDIGIKCNPCPICDYR